ncbi:MAG: hypothetical protein ABI342_04730 [Nitrososphaera sp.]|jgi:hypothetical protein
MSKMDNAVDSLYFGNADPNRAFTLVKLARKRRLLAKLGLYKAFKMPS